MENLPNTPELPQPPESWLKKTKKHSKTKMSDDKKMLYVHAWKEVKSGRKTIYSAAKENNLTFSTLWSWCQRDNIAEVQPSPGRPAFLGSVLEKKLENFVTQSQRTGFIKYLYFHLYIVFMQLSQCI